MPEIQKQECWRIDTPFAKIRKNETLRTGLTLLAIGTLAGIAGLALHLTGYNQWAVLESVGTGMSFIMATPFLGAHFWEKRKIQAITWTPEQDAVWTKEIQTSQA